MLRWWALIGPVLSLEPSRYLTTPHNAARVLEGEFQLGSLTLRPGERQLIDYARILDVGWKQSVFWPILVESESAAHDWPDAEREAAHALHRLVCLLSLAWDEAWQVRVGPQDVANIPPLIPEDSSLPPGWWPDYSPQVGLRDEEPLPTWLIEAWQRLETEPASRPAAAALSLWHEGILLKAEHPSFALVAFAASIEQLGHLLPKPLNAPTSGARAQFWAALEIVLTASDIALLRKHRAYDLRSATAHGGKVHGIETAFGAVLTPPPLSNRPIDPMAEFVHRIVPLLGRASRLLLLRLFEAVG